MECPNLPEVGASASCRLAVLNGVAGVSNLGRKISIDGECRAFGGRELSWSQFGVAGVHFDASELQLFQHTVSRGG